MTPADYARARRTLLRGDAVLAALIKRHGPCGLAAAQRTDHFSALVRAITNQQLSTKAAATIYGRLAALIPGGTPTPEGLRKTYRRTTARGGLQPAKDRVPARSLRTRSGRPLDLRTIDDLPDDEVIGALTNVKGIGRWSAEMFLMFRLHRPDVLPVGDSVS